MLTTAPPEGAQLDATLAPIRSHVIGQIRTRRRTRRWGFATAGAAGALSCALVVGNLVGISPLPLIGGSSQGATAQAAEFLDSAAAAAIETSDPVVGPGQFLRVATDAVWAGMTSDDGVVLLPQTLDLYIPADRSAEWVWERRPLPPTTYFGMTKEQAFDMYQSSVGDPDLDAVLRAEEGAFYGSPRADYKLDDLPRDPIALRDHFYDEYNGGSASIDEDVWVRITDILRTGEVRADLRAALYKTIALVPDVEITEEQAVLDGRTGVALGRVEPNRGSRVEIIIDPATGLMIGEREVALEGWGPVPAGTVTSSTSIETTVVDRTP